MHSFHPSRGRILFEVFCALAIAASVAGAWLQTGASALLGAAAIAVLYGFIHLFDLGQRKPAEDVELQRVEFEPELQVEPPAHQDARRLLAVVDEQLAAERRVEEAKLAESEPAKSTAGRRTKVSRKGNSRRTNAKEAEVADPVVQEVLVDDPIPAPPEEHVHVAPLFEPDRFARMHRPAFGRKTR